MTEEQKEQLQYFKETGENFGYPPCCVEAFLKDIEGMFANDEIVRDPIRVTHAFQGFVPCSEHANFIVTNGYREMTELINLNRAVTLPFPFDNQTLNELMMTQMKHLIGNHKGVLDQVNNAGEASEHCDECKNALTKNLTEKDGKDI